MHKLRERLLCGGLGEGGAEEGAAPLTSQSIVEQSSASSKFRRPSLPLLPPFHPQSLLSISGSLQVGCSRFSRCCNLIVDLRSISAACEDRSWARRLTQSPELGFGLSCSCTHLRRTYLCRCNQHFSLCAVERFVHLS